jgi:hypothetical protein
MFYFVARICGGNEMEYSRIITRAVLFLICTGIANPCCAVDSNCVECGDCDPCKTPRYIQVTLSNIIPFNGGCDNSGECDVNSSSINGTYILEWIEPDGNHPWCRWCYTNSDPNFYSTRSPGYPGYDPLTGDTATGLRICVTRDYYSNNTMWIIADTVGGSEYGYACYFSVAEAPVESGCVNNSGVANEQNNCYCSSWMYIPPWSAGLGGVAKVKELVVDGVPICFVNFEEFAGFADSWLEAGFDLDFDLDGDGDVDFEDLSRLTDLWLH